MCNTNAGNEHSVPETTVIPLAISNRETAQVTMATDIP
jgi:hypothetical protein